MGITGCCRGLRGANFSKQPVCLHVSKCIHHQHVLSGDAGTLQESIADCRVACSMVKLSAPEGDQATARPQPRPGAMSQSKSPKREPASAEWLSPSAASSTPALWRKGGGSMRDCISTVGGPGPFSGLSCGQPSSGGRFADSQRADSCAPLKGTAMSRALQSATSVQQNAGYAA